MMRLHAALKSQHFPNCRKIAADLEVSPKTIQRDIDFMRDRLGLPIGYDAQKFGFYYTEAVTGFPSIEVSEGEITALFVAQKALAQYKGTPFERPLQSAFRKITDGLKDRVSFSWTDLEDVISFRSAGASPADLELFEIVSKAVLRSVELTFEYRKLKSSELRTAPGASVSPRLPRESMVSLRGRFGPGAIADVCPSPHAKRLPDDDRVFAGPRTFPSPRF